MITILYSAVIIIVLACITLWKVKLPERGTCFDNTMAINNTLPLRGLFAITILLHHFSAEFTEPYFLGLFTHIGYLLVAAFFFLSGYGLAFGFNKSSDYIRLKTFVPKRFFKTIMPYWLCILFSAVIIALFLPPLSLKSFLLSFISEKSIVNYSWYVFVILILYAAFMIIFRIGNKKHAMAVMFVFIAILTAAFLLKGYSIHARSLLSFYFGLFYCFKERSIDEYVKKHFWIKAVIVLLIFALLCALRFYFYSKSSFRLVDVFALMSSSVFAVLVFVFFTKKVRLGNAVLDFLGKISYEIYLMHGLFCDLFRPKGLNMLLFCAAVVTCTVIASFAINSVAKLFSDFYFKKLKSK